MSKKFIYFNNSNVPSVEILVKYTDKDGNSRSIKVKDDSLIHVTSPDIGDFKSIDSVIALQNTMRPETHFDQPLLLSYPPFSEIDIPINIWIAQNYGTGLSFRHPDKSLIGIEIQDGSKGPKKKEITKKSNNSTAKKSTSAKKKR